MVLMRKTPFRCMDLMNNDSSDEDSEVSVTEEMLSIFLACQAEMKTLDQGKSFWCRANYPELVAGLLEVSGPISVASFWSARLRCIAFTISLWTPCWIATTSLSNSQYRLKRLACKPGALHPRGLTGSYTGVRGCHQWDYNSHNATKPNQPSYQHS